MTDTNLNRQQLMLRIGRGTMAFASRGETGRVTYEPYVVKSGVSMAANLREAFKTSDLLLSAPPRVQVLIDSDVLVVPIDIFDEPATSTLYRHSFTGHEADAVAYNVVPELKAVALFAINRDLRLVIDDHFRDVQTVCAQTPVWRHLNQRSYTSQGQAKLYAWMHEKRTELFSFQQNRFRFTASFESPRAHDVLYYVMCVWKQLGMRPDHDQLHLVGDVPEADWLTAQMRRFVQNVFVINPEADFNQHPASAVKGMPYDLMTFMVKGR